MTLTRVPRLVWIALVVVLVAAVVWQANTLRIDHRNDSRRDAAVAMAEAQVIDLTTLDSKTVTKKVAAMAARTSGDFKAQLDGITNTFVKVVEDRKISASGQVAGIGVTSSSDKDATVLVASNSTVTEADGKPTARAYRIRVKLGWTEGAWKINGMEFVQ